MAIRMVGLDLDGTLFNSAKELTAHTKEILEKAMAAGVVIVPATGRPKTGLPKCLSELEGIRYAVVTNGGGLYDLREGRFIYERCMEREASIELMERTRRLEHAVQGVFIGEWGYMEPVDFERTANLPLVEAMKDYIRSSRKVVESIPALIRESAEQPQKLVIMFYADETGHMPDLARARAITDQYPQFSVVSGGVGNVEITDAAAGKGTALLALGELLGISREEIMAVGDSENDLDMILKAGLGVAMANGEDIIREHADAITASNDEEGVAQAIEKYVLGGRA